MKMRIRLQKFLQNETRDDRTFEKANECLTHVELLPVNADFLEYIKATKLSKVLKKIPSMEGDVNSEIKQRVNSLLSRWATEMAGDVEPNSAPVSAVVEEVTKNASPENKRGSVSPKRAKQDRSASPPAKMIDTHKEQSLLQSI